ncbi:MAG: hypothetical protein QHI38_10360 [Armatimonadota bacterium]|nr:hypothetical protein [Armatimonadota bacterium]
MFRSVVGAFVLFSCVVLPGMPSAFGAEVLDAFFAADKPFPQFVQYWSDLAPEEWAAAAERESSRPLGGYIHVYIRNNTAHKVSVEDVLLQGVSLKRAIAFSSQRKFKKAAFAASIYFSDLSQSERGVLSAAGEPVWYKVDPLSVDPDSTAGIVIRLRQRPAVSKLDLTLKLDSGDLNVSVDTSPRKSLVKSVGFGSGLNEVYCYFEKTSGANGVQQVLLDGRDVTSECTIAADPGLSLVPVVCRVSKPLQRGSFHTFTAVFGDGSKATAGLRCWDDELFYGMWGARPGKSEDLVLARGFIDELGEHNINGHMITIASDAVRTYMNSPEGRKHMERLGIRRVVMDPAKELKPAAYYLADEPDTADYKVENVPPGSRIGCLGQGLVQRAYELRNTDPITPNMLNVDMTFKPDNWYTYGQLPDIFAADPYFQSHLADVYYRKPYRLSAYTKATEVYAVAACAHSACAPKPLHIILNCTQIVRSDWRFRFATPVEKRIEVYYALAAGAKAFSYWWFVPLSAKGVGSNGLGANTPEARLLWREIGLLGAELRTASSLITRACPVDLDVAADKRLWVKSLVSGADTLIVLVVNDDYACDRAGTVIKPVSNAKLKIPVPRWLAPTSVFEVSCGGISGVKWQVDQGALTVDLGEVDVTRFIVVTSNPDLQHRLQETYQSRFAQNVAKLQSQK